MSKVLIIKLITYYSLQYGISPDISVAVCAVESQFNPNAIGITHDIGLFQLNPKSFPHYSERQLLNPRTNIRLGIKYLAKVKKECKHNKGIEWLTCYNLGVKGASNVKHPNLWPYVKLVKGKLDETTN